jgi:hypothetical protein
MRKKQILGTILTLSLIFIVSATCFAPVAASVPYYAHASTSGATIINIPDHQPPIQVVAIHFDGGDHGVGDYLEVSTLQNIPGHGNVWVPIAVVTNSPSIAAFYRDFVFAGQPTANNIQLVKHCELQVCGIGKIVSVNWMKPIASPELTLPPGCLLFRGYGPAQTVQSVFHLPNGVTLTVDKNANFDAHATFVCLSWKYCGPVGNEGTTISRDVDLSVSHA